MTTHAAVGRAAGARVAGEVRAELARQRKTGADLAAALGITPHTAGRRLAGDVPFDVIELMQVCAWLEVPVQRFLATENGAA